MDQKLRKKLLILGASDTQVPLIKTAKQLGFETYVLDYNPHASGIPLSDHFALISTIDQDKVCEYAAKIQPHGIVTVATDMPMRAISKASEALGLSGISFDTSVRATDKGFMIRAFEEHDVRHPDFLELSVEDDLECLSDLNSFPYIIKPCDSSGSRGVIKVENMNELLESINYSRKYSRNGNIIVEEFLEGKEVSVEVLVNHGEFSVIAITDKLTTGAPHFVELGHNEPSLLPDDIQKEIREIAVAALKAVGVFHGAGHVEVMVTDQGPKIIELGARLGGDYITTDLVPLYCGVNMLEAIIRLSCNENPDIKPKFRKASAIRFLSGQEGTVSSISGVEEAKKIPGIRKVQMLVDVDDEVHSLESSLDRIGYIIAQGNSPQEAIAICEKAMKLISVEIC